jgi:hypothetical protein
MAIISFTAGWGIGKFPFHPDARVRLVVHSRTVNDLFRQCVYKCYQVRKVRDRPIKDSKSKMKTS